MSDFSVKIVLTILMESHSCARARMHILIGGPSRAPQSAMFCPTVWRNSQFSVQCVRRPGDLTLGWQEVLFVCLYGVVRVFAHVFSLRFRFCLLVSFAFLFSSVQPLCCVSVCVIYSTFVRE